jgi:uncharacterized protein
MRFILPASAGILLCFLASCGRTATTFSDINTQEITLPGGQTIQVERMMSTADQMRGMMFRTSLAPDRGMLYVHKTPGLFPYWTFQYEIPLDMIWMDTSRQIVEIVENVPPCKSQASQCPHYGGTKVARYHLELAGGMAAKYGLKAGEKLEF